MKSILKQYLSVILLLLCFSLPSIANELVPHTASYTAKIKKGISIKGQAIRELKRSSDGQWLYSFNVDSFVADINESTLLSWDDQHVIPKVYQYKLSVFLARDKKKEVHFDWKTMSAINPIKKSGWSIKNIPIHTLDRLSYQLQLGMDLQSGKKEMFYRVAHKGKLRENQFKVTGEEKINTTLGFVDSITVIKVREKSKKRKTHMWFSKQYPLLLLKMIQVEKNGDEYEININHAVIDGKNIIFN